MKFITKSDRIIQTPLKEIEIYVRRAPVSAAEDLRLIATENVSLRSRMEMYEATDSKLKRKEWLETYNAALSSCRNVESENAFNSARDYATKHANALHGELLEITL